MQTTTTEPPPPQSVSFSITEPTTAVERLVAYCLGGLGLVHQYTVMLPFQRDATLNTLFTDDEVRDLVAGTTWNDSPSASELDAAAYRRDVLEPVPHPYAPYITDERFRVQMRHDLRLALAASYKRVPALLQRIVGLDEPTIEEGAAMLERRAAGERAHYHFLRERRDESDDSVVQRATATGARFYELALRRRNTFVLGHVLHMLGDAYSYAHTDRDQSSGRLRRVYYFGDQTDRSHSAQESWHAVSTMPEVRQRIELLVPRISAVLHRYAADRDAAVGTDVGRAVAAWRDEVWRPALLGTA